MKQPTVSRQRTLGFSLVELLVASAITLIGLLVITQVFAVYEGWKRTTIGVAQGQEGGLLGAFSIEQDLRHVGFGMISTSCSAITAYNSEADPQTIKLSETGSSVSIGTDEGENKNNTITVLYSSSPYGNDVAKTQRAMAKASEPLYVDNGLAFSSGDLILISSGSSCSILQVSGNPVATVKTEKLVANVTSPGSAWELPHATTGDGAPWNPPDEEKYFPSYPVGASVHSLGQDVIAHRFYVQDGKLRMDERHPKTGSLTSYDLIPGVVGLRAQCLPGACNDNPAAVRFSLIVRSGNWEKDLVSPASIAFWPDETLSLDSEAQHYRYRVFQTIVPLKNVIWNK